MGKKRLGRAAFVILWICSLYFGMASAAAQESVSIEFENDSTVYVYVEDQPVQLKVLETASKKDVTNEASWESSQPKKIKVVKGLVTGLDEGEATLTAKYKGASVSIRAVSSYLFDKLQLVDSRSGDALPDEISIELGTERQIEAIAVDGETEYEVTANAQWSTSNANIVSVKEGRIKPEGKGTATIKASYKGRSVSLKVVVRSPFQSMRINSEELLEMKVGDEPVSLTAEAVKPTGEAADVTELAVWKTSNAGVVKVNKGQLEPVGVGMAKVTVEYLGVSAQLEVMVLPAYQAMKLLPDDPLRLMVNESGHHLRVYVLNEVDHLIDVTNEAAWTSANPLVATVKNGLVTPKTPGTTTIKVSYKGLSKELAVNVYPILSKIEFKSSSLELFRGEKAELPVVAGTTIADEQWNVTPLVDWTSDNSEVVDIQNGKLVAKKSGTAVLRAKARHLSAEIPVTVHEKVLVLKPSETEIRLITGREATLPAVTAIYENGTQENVTDKVTWKVSSPNLLVAEGKLTGLVSSKVRLTATYLNKTVTIPVEIEDEIVKFEIEPKSILVYPGKSQAIKVTGYYENGKKVNLSSKIDWKSETETIATVKGRSVKGVAEGKTVIVGTYQGKTLQVPVEVYLRLKKLTASESSVQLSPGQSRGVKITAHYDANKTMDITTQAVWTSSKPDVAAFSDGQIRAFKPGVTTLKATFDGKTVSIRIKVK